MASLFDPITIRGITIRNRTMLSPMCMYSATNGFPNDWHFVHLGSRAVGGAGLILTEDTAVLEEGRISAGDLGLWSDEHIKPLARIADFVHAQGAAFGFQLGYSGRKGSTTIPWRGGQPLGEGRALGPNERPWQTFGPSPIAYGGTRGQVRTEMSIGDIRRVQQGFVDAALRADKLGADVVEFHAAWGYVFQQFYSPLSNQRDDEYGGSFDNRIRFLLETAEAVREVWPPHKPLFARIALSDWVEGGWTFEEAVALSSKLQQAGVDLVDGSSGGIGHFKLNRQLSPLMHVLLIKRVREEAGIATGANFGIETPEEANEIVKSNVADMVTIGRAMLRDPYWACHAAEALKDDRLFYPNPYEHWLTGRSVVNKSEGQNGIVNGLT
ncbi:hypothetical protein W97_08000 [Coniosporium apollinis CBS 100218]|uniref:NADH:flavin oxidoreductase/NADH oxidase N-terminal domain-containing protein n=1 Tax=Coniosporium apollinis (strain CBS 100218) TaxID=1168221 RepID=R7Z3J8_CONA1|nr:uncharacterized protein W97_08000 [Coniosporium apollinis CBS 100218]EON68742.1 hypothetical protein W97_08000 [Coniosporium apollinis CBS 100218]